MKALVTILAMSIALAAVPAVADTIYSNGPTNGNSDAWTINFGFMVIDSFSVANNYTTITGFTMADWLIPGDGVISAQLSISSLANGGTLYFNQTVNFTQSGCLGNSYGYDVCTETAGFNGPTLNAGTYWLRLQNASDYFGVPIYWDENSGPSRALDCCGSGWPDSPPWPNAVGTIPSESFTVLGQEITWRGGEASPAIPEPASVTLLASGGMALFAIIGGLRRRLF